MRNTTALRFITGAGFGVGIARKVHPLRDPEGHDDANKKVDDKDDKDDKKQPFKAKIVDDKDDPVEQAKAAQAALEESRKLSSWLIAEANWKLGIEQDKTKTDEDRALEAKVAEAAQELVVAATTPLLERIEKMQGQLVDAAITGELAARQLTIKDVQGAYDTLDRTKFLGEDGTVKADLVKSWAASFSAGEKKRPPRTGGSGSGNDRGFGRYLDKTT